MLDRRLHNLIFAAARSALLACTGAAVSPTFISVCLGGFHAHSVVPCMLVIDSAMSVTFVAGVAVMSGETNHFRCEMTTME